MFNTLYLLSYNNYYNRIIKKFDIIDNYMDYVNTIHPNINFNPNDGIEAQQILDVSDLDNSDYLIVIDNNNNIISRWFIIDKNRIRGNQYKFNLRRDVVADYYNIILQSPCFVQKGFVDTSNPLIYNSENVTFNQIKKGEYLLKNELNTPWLVAYLSRWQTAEDGTQNVYNNFTGSFIDETEIVPDYILDSLDDYIYKKYEGDSSNAYIYTDDITFCMYYQLQSDVNRDGTTAPDRTFGLTKSGYYRNTLNYNAITSVLPVYNGNGVPIFTTGEERTNIYNKLYNKYLSYATIDSVTGLPINSYSKLGTFEGFKTLTEESNKIIQVGSGSTVKYYRILTNVSNSQYSGSNEKTLYNVTGSFGNYVFDQLTSMGNWNLEGTYYRAPFIKFPYQNTGVYLNIIEITPGKKILYNFTYTNNITTQTPYEIVAAPLNDITFTKNGDTYQHNGTIALSWFLNMAEKGHAAGLVYDIQIVPYCPVYSTNIEEFQIASCYYEDAVTTPLALLLKIPNASFTRTYSVPEEIPIELDYKVSVNCDLYRLCSPNGVGDFDFSVAKNNGLSGYEIDCTLMPFNPYIKINPLFNTSGLYGGDYNDFRGLICGGDFSLPITSNQWENYQLNNKNFQAIFDRETKTLDMQNKWNIAETVTGIATGALSGAATGGFLAGVPGAIAGGVLSAGAGATDLIRTLSLQEEQMSARRDLFNLNLQTIRARPNTLTRTTAFNINNKYFPYIEYYSCTDNEKEIFKNKIKYEGMTINAIGTIADYLGPTETYIKGKLIRLPIEDDYHVAQEIVNEIIQGVYIKGGN